jgi:hypothetical protein
MGLIAKLRAALGGGKFASEKNRNAVLQDRWLQLTHPLFSGRAYCSPDQRWVIGCKVFDNESGNGRLVLVNYASDTVEHELNSFVHPMGAAVSNTGTYIVVDAGCGSELEGLLVAIDSRGNELYRKCYHANIFNIGISDCGRYAAVQTANAMNTDADLFEVLDIKLGRLVFSRLPVTGWPDQYTFDTDSAGELKAVGVVHKSLGEFFYSSHGEFRDQKAFQDARLGIGHYVAKISAARELLQTTPTADNAIIALFAADEALQEGAEDRADWGALAHHIRGESYELLGQLPEAMAAFEQALRLNPKADTQNSASSLRKKLDTNKLA